MVQVPQLRTLEGHRVGLALTDGRRIDDCQVVCAPRTGLQTVWVLLADGADVFIPVAALADVWECTPGVVAAA